VVDGAASVDFASPSSASTLFAAFDAAVAACGFSLGALPNCAAAASPSAALGSAEPGVFADGVACAAALETRLPARVSSAESASVGSVADDESPSAAAPVVDWSFFAGVGCATSSASSVGSAFASSS
jgi:hypothetical protein